MMVGLGVELTALRRRARLTQEQMAERCGLSVRTLRNIESGRHVPRISTVDMIVEGLDLDVASAARLHAVVAGQEPEIDGRTINGGDRWPAPHRLPADSRHFSGREAELQWLDAAVRLEGASEAPPLVVVSGTAGVGKTALVVRWARSRSGAYPDGEVFVDLRGYSSEVPVEPPEALARLLAQVGREPTGGTVEDLAVAWRSALDGRRVLIVLDNAASTVQVRPLLPTGPTCAVVITSRDTLAGLVAREGAARIDLDVLPVDDSLRLLRKILPSRVCSDAQALRRLAEACAHLPLALRIAGERATAGRYADIGTLADDLRREPLSGLDTPGDPETAVRAILMVSYRVLPARARRAFRLLGVHPAPTFDRDTAAHLLGVPISSAVAELDPLLRAHMLMTRGRTEFAMHDLLHAFARELSDAEDRPSSDAAFGRLVDHLLPAAKAAIAQGDPPSRRWLAERRAVLVAIAVGAARRGRPEATVSLADALGGHLETVAAYPDLAALMGVAAEAAHRIGREDRAAQSWRLLAVAYYRLGQPDEALAAGRRALDAFRSVGDRRGEARCLMNIGSIWWRSGLGNDALVNYRGALELYRAEGVGTGVAGALCNIGIVLEEHGEIDAAIRYYTDAATAYERCGDQRPQSIALTNLGQAYAKIGRFEDAAEALERAVSMTRVTQNRNDEGIALGNLGDLCVRRGRDREARRYFVQALRAARDVGDRIGEGLMVDSLGAIHRRRHDCHRAERAHMRALRLAQETRDREVQCLAIMHLAEVALDQDQIVIARERLVDALACATDLGAPIRLAQALNVLASVEERAGDRTAALAARRRALACARRAGDTQELVATLHGLAVLHDSQ